MIIKANSTKIKVQIHIYLLLAILQIIHLPIASADQTVDIHGFLTAAGGILSNEKTKHKAYSKDFDFSQDSILGLQVMADINEDYRITSQIVASGIDGSKVRLDWGYLSHDITDSFTLRLGRMRSPLYLYSESLEVGYAYPWISPPAEVYDIIPFRAFNGIQGYYKQPWEDWEISYLGYFGSAKEQTEINSEIAEVSLRNFTGLAVALDRQWFSFQLGLHRADTSFSANGTNALIEALRSTYPEVASELDVDDKDANFYQLGVQVNWEKFLIISEATKMEVARSFIPSSRSWYGLLGYNVTQKLLLHFTYAKIDSELQQGFTDPIPQGVNPDLDGLRTGIETLLQAVDAKQNSSLIGMRYDPTEGVAYKVEWQRITVFSDRDSVGGKTDYSSGGYTDVLSIAVDVIF